MTFEDYQKECYLINQRLDQISEKTGQMALANTANAENPDFVSLMKEYLEKTKASETMTEKMMQELGI